MENHSWQVKLTLLLVSSLTIMSVITISPALPQMMIVFAKVNHANILVKLALTLPALMIALFAPIAGRLIDRHGRVKMLNIALVIYAIAGSSGYFLDNLYLILLSRAVLGLAVGASMTIVITLIADYFDGKERLKFVGTQIAFMSLGGILFIGLGGILAGYSWKYPFLIYLFALLVLPLSIGFLKEPKTVKPSLSQKALVSVPKIIWLLFINNMVIWIIYFFIPVQLPFHLQGIGVEKAALIGAAIATSTLFSAISALLYSRIKGRFSFVTIFSLGYLLMAAGFFCIAISHSYALILFAMALAGVGMGMMVPNTNMWVMKIVPPEIRGREIGKLTTFWFLGQFISPLIISPILSAFSSSATYMLASGLLIVMSLGYLVFYFSKIGKSVVQ